jgi:hypothetical protein
LVWIEQKVTEDETLGGLTVDSQVQQIQWVLEPGEEEFVGAVVDIVVSYYTTGDASESD